MSGGRIPREFINELLVRIDIVDLIDSHVPLKKSGANYVARCPFHVEKTPSFSVSRKKQFFHCFGCGASGNAISFLMAFSHLDFVEAVEDLASFAGLDVPRESVSSVVAPAKTDLSSLYLVLEAVAAFYTEQLRASVDGKKAVTYLKNRGVKSEIAMEFMLGYAPSQYSLLVKQFNQQLLVDVGLLGVSDNGSIYARFRDRLIFPIRDKRAKIIGFGGRVLDDSLPKYLNSPETALFHKGREVYGLHELLKKNPKPQRILLVEGYMDVIALAQFGVDYAVAALGTAVSEAHLDLLFRFSSELVFCFDGDIAGRIAAWKAMDAAFCCMKDGRSCRIMLLPPHHDPDSLIHEEGVDRFTNRVQSAQALSDYFFGTLTEKLNLTEIEACAQLVSEVRPYLEKIPSCVFKDMMSVRLKELSGIGTIDVLQEEVIAPDNSQKSTQRYKTGRPPLERQTLALLVQYPNLISLIEDKDIDWNYLNFKGVEKFKAIIFSILDEKPANTAVLLESYRNNVDERIIKQLALLKLEVPLEGIEAEFCGALDKLIYQGKALRFNCLLVKLESKGLDLQEKEELKRLSMFKIEK